MKLLDLWPFLIPSPDIQKTKFFQFLLLASSLAQKLKKFCFLDVWVGIHLVVSGYRVVIICILSQNRQKWQKKAKTTQVCAFVEGKPFGVEKSYLQFWMRTNLKIQHKFWPGKSIHKWLRKCAKTWKQAKNGKFWKIWVKKGQKTAKVAILWAAVEAKPFGREKIYRHHWMRRNLKIQHKFWPTKVSHIRRRKCAKTKKKPKMAFFFLIFGFCGFTPWRRLGGNFLHKRWIKV